MSKAETLRMMAASIATGAEIVDRQMVVRDLCEAADEIDDYRERYNALQSAVVGNTGLSGIMEAERLRALHPLS